MYAFLVAADSDDIAIFSFVLQQAGLAVTTVRELSQALKSWPDRPADIILLALSHPSPEEQVQQVRSEIFVPLIINLNHANETLHCQLLKMGADLVVEPNFNVKILIARIIALMRRSSTVPTISLPTLEAPGFSLDPASRTVELSGKPDQRLTHLEFRLLYTLMINRGQIIPAETLVERVWGYTGKGDKDLIRGLISRLRTKTEIDPRNPQYIITIPGIGYSFKDESS